MILRIKAKQSWSKPALFSFWLLSFIKWLTQVTKKKKNECKSQNSKFTTHFYVAFLYYYYYKSSMTYSLWISILFNISKTELLSWSGNTIVIVLQFDVQFLLRNPISSSQPLCAVSPYRLCSLLPFTEIDYI